MVRTLEDEGVEKGWMVRTLEDGGVEKRIVGASAPPTPQKMIWASLFSYSPLLLPSSYSLSLLSFQLTTPG
jgi:hypothetical protein